MNTTPTIPSHKLGQAMQHMVEMGKRPCFRIEGLHITIASEVSANPGYLYIKDDNWNYIGKVTPDGYMKITFPSLITAVQKTVLMAAVHDPEEIAMSNGQATGTCCCCGRTLTNKLSIELGIGPICRGFWFPPANVDIMPTDTVAMLETLDAVKELNAITDSLDLDLGAYRSPKPPKGPVMEIVNSYKSLNDTQRMICLILLVEIESNASN